MLINEEFVRGIEHYGRWHMQEYVARSQEMIDVLTYLRAERTLEMFKAVSFITVDSVHFLKRTDPSPIFDEGRRPIQQEEREL
ncbi:MAG TPA: hypothetical protein VLZ10_12260 [Thermodesulfobacteriota bacterium]|nr:hypothetical protein [Thermodesulfobacteriota bacterium]